MGTNTRTVALIVAAHRVHDRHAPIGGTMRPANIESARRIVLSAPAGAGIIVIMVVPFVPLWFAGLVVRLPVVLSFVLSLAHRRFSADYGRLCRRMP